MDTSQAVEYIRQQLASGFSEADVRNSLLAGGWQPDVIDQVFSMYHGNGAMYASSGYGGRSWIKRTLIVAGVIVLLAGGILVYLIASSDKLNKLAQPALKRNATKVSQETDIANLASVVSDYQTKNGGALPMAVKATGEHTLQLCGAICEDKGPTATLNFYEARQVQLQSYAEGLEAPNVQTVFMVVASSCLADHSGLGSESSGSQSSLAFLYAIDSGSGTKQQCKSL